MVAGGVMGGFDLGVLPIGVVGVDAVAVAVGVGVGVGVAGAVRG